MLALIGGALLSTGLGGTLARLDRRGLGAGHVRTTFRDDSRFVLRKKETLMTDIVYPLDWPTCPVCRQARPRRAYHRPALWNADELAEQRARRLRPAPLTQAYVDAALDVLRRRKGHEA